MSVCYGLFFGAALIDLGDDLPYSIYPDSEGPGIGGIGVEISGLIQRLSLIR